MEGVLPRLVYSWHEEKSIVFSVLQSAGNLDVSVTSDKLRYASSSCRSEEKTD
jgi:hypothetical protein